MMRGAFAAGRWTNSLFLSARSASIKKTKFIGGGIPNAFYRA